MLFNSYAFLYAFLPVVTVGFFALGSRSPRLAQAWLLLASLFFYGWWKPAYVWLLLVSICANYALGEGIRRQAPGSSFRKTLLVAGIVGNLAALAYFKYAGFLLSNLNAATGWRLPHADIVLPVGISFYTFTSLAYIVEVYQEKVRESDFIRYGLFISYFPHLVAGPVLYHNEVIPQFGRPETYRFNVNDWAVGLTLFFMGLFKKVVFADGISRALADASVQPAFWRVQHGVPVTFFDGWVGALAYTLQLYFDFSGYSDMAVGISRLFGVTLPVNFASPYKSVNIVEFWRRWHMTLGRWLRNYVYIPLGGNRRGPVRRSANLLATMTLCGLWHGAGWTFVVWGALHGGFIVINRAFTRLRERFGCRKEGSVAGRLVSRVLTFVVVVIGWVIFKANTFGEALAVLDGMRGANGFVLRQADLASLGASGHWMQAHGVQFERLYFMPFWGALLWLVPLLAIAWFAPNTQEMLSRYAPVLDTYGSGEPLRTPRWLAWSPTLGWGLAVSALALVSIISLKSGTTEFLYFRF
jgi:alginate O-acetyltransferase complex protein AlgI